MRSSKNPLVAAILLLYAAGALADDAVNSGNTTEDEWPLRSEPFDSGWAVQLDNDAFNGSSRDQDYTGGLAVTLSGRRVKGMRISGNRLLEWFDKASNIHAHNSHNVDPQGHAIQFGLIAFTPARLELRRPVLNDRPYASLVYLTNSRFSVHEDQAVAHQSHLTIGVLGTPLSEWFQKGIHRLTDSTAPKGYESQISNGGELTARYAVSRQSLLYRKLVRGNQLELTHGAEASIGFITEVSTSISARWGQYSSPWWIFTPERSVYIPQSRPVAPSRLQDRRGREHYFWAGVSLRARVYNAFLQGQFRQSDVTFSHNELTTLIPDLSVGLTMTLRDRWQITYGVRYQGQEIRSGPGTRSVIWAGIRFQHQ